MRIAAPYRQIRAAARGLADLLYPPLCRACSRRMATEERVICTSCWEGMERTDLGNWASLLTYGTGVDAALVGWYFDASLQTVIHAMKYEEMKSVGRKIGEALGEIFGEELRQWGVTRVAFVPLHPAKARARGYNQSELIASGVASVLGLPMERKLLARVRNTPSQTALSVTERKENVSGAFRTRAKCGGQSFLLVDDVITTGATASACATALKEAGALFVALLAAGTPRPIAA